MKDALQDRYNTIYFVQSTFLLKNKLQFSVNKKEIIPTLNHSKNENYFQYLIIDNI